MKQELSSALGKRQVTKFIKDHQIDSGQAVGESAAFTQQFFLLQLIDQIDQIEVATATAVTNQLPGDGNRQMGLAGSGSANQDDVGLAGEELPFVERSHLGFIDRCETRKSNWSRSLVTGNLA